MLFTGPARPVVRLGALAGPAAAPPSIPELLAQTTPVRRSFDLRVPMASTPVPIDGKRQLAYELD